MSRDFFGFKDEPFSAFPDNKYFFSSILHDKAITLLEYGLNSRKGFMLLTGLKGTGKTMTCNIMKDSASNCNVSMINYENVTPDVLMKQICSGFGLDFKESGKQELFGRIMEYFVDQYKEGRNNLIIVDNAEKISDENLQMLSSFLEIEIEKCKLVQVVISGCPELHDRLKHLGGDLGPKFTFTVELAPLSLRDTTEYVEHRLKTAVGDDDVHLFKSNSYSEIYNYSKGIPSEINRIAQKALAIAKEKKQGKVTLGNVRMAAARLYGVKATRKLSKMPAVVVLLLLILGGGGFYFKDMLSADKFFSALDRQDTPVKEEVYEKPAVSEPVTEFTPEPEPAEKTVQPDEIVIQTPETTDVLPEETVHEPVKEQAAVAESSPEPLPEPEALPEPVAEVTADTQHGCITAQSGLKIRDGASVDSELIGTAPYMEYIELLELSADGNWWKTNYNGSEGYMFARYIKVVNSPDECKAE